MHMPRRTHLAVAASTLALVVGAAAPASAAIQNSRVDPTPVYGDVNYATTTYGTTTATGKIRMTNVNVRITGDASELEDCPAAEVSLTLVAPNGDVKKRASGRLCKSGGYERYWPTAFDGITVSPRATIITVIDFKRNAGADRTDAFQMPVT